MSTVKKSIAFDVGYYAGEQRTSVEMGTTKIDAALKQHIPAKAKKRPSRD